MNKQTLPENGQEKSSGEQGVNFGHVHSLLGHKDEFSILPRFQEG